MLDHHLIHKEASCAEAEDPLDHLQDNLVRKIHHSW